MLRRLDAAAEGRLADALAAEPALLPFARAAALQLARGGPSPEAAALRVAGLLRDAGLLAAPAVTDAAAELADDPALLAAFFQNVDLLYEESFARADAVSLLVMAALERLAPPG